MSKADTNIHIQSLCGPMLSFLLGKTLKSRIAGPKSMFNVRRNDLVSLAYWL